MRSKNRRKLTLGQETIANLELALVAGGASSDSGDTDGITRPGMASCWSCFLTHCCKG
jgi:hypothetical protein